MSGYETGGRPDFAYPLNPIARQMKGAVVRDMTCPFCGGYVMWEPPGGAWPAHYRCQACRRPYKVAAVKKTPIAEPGKEVTSVTEEVNKVCNKCGRSLPLGQFSKQAQNSDGLRRHCRECQSKIHAAWYLKTKGAVEEVARKVIERHKEVEAPPREQSDKDRILSILIQRRDKIDQAIRIIEESL